MELIYQKAKLLLLLRTIFSTESIYFFNSFNDYLEYIYLYIHNQIYMKTGMGNYVNFYI